MAALAPQYCCTAASRVLSLKRPYSVFGADKRTTRSQVESTKDHTWMPSNGINFAGVVERRPKDNRWTSGHGIRFLSDTSSRRNSLSSMRLHRESFENVTFQQSGADTDMQEPNATPASTTSSDLPPTTTIYTSIPLKQGDTTTPESPIDLESKSKIQLSSSAMSVGSGSGTALPTVVHDSLSKNQALVASQSYSTKDPRLRPYTARQLCSRSELVAKKHFRPNKMSGRISAEMNTRDCALPDDKSAYGRLGKYGYCRGRTQKTPTPDSSLRTSVPSCRAFRSNPHTEVLPLCMPQVRNFHVASSIMRIGRCRHNEAGFLSTMIARRLSARIGFEANEVVPIEHDSERFRRLQSLRSEHRLGTRRNISQVQSLTELNQLVGFCLETDVTKEMIIRKKKTAILTRAWEIRISFPDPYSDLATLSIVRSCLGEPNTPRATRLSAKQNYEKEYCDAVRQGINAHEKKRVGLWRYGRGWRSDPNHDRSDCSGPQLSFVKPYDRNKTTDSPTNKDAWWKVASKSKLAPENQEKLSSWGLGMKPSTSLGSFVSGGCHESAEFEPLEVYALRFETSRSFGDGGKDVSLSDSHLLDAEDQKSRVQDQLKPHRLDDKKIILIEDGMSFRIDAALLEQAVVANAAIDETRLSDKESGASTAPEESLSHLALSPSDSTPAKTYWDFSLYKNAAGMKPSVHYCRKIEQSEREAQAFLNEKVVGFDLEWAMTRIYGRSSIKDNVSLIQVASESRIALFHISLHRGDTAEDLLAPSLRKLIESPDILKVGVAISGDCTRIRNNLGVEAKGVFELSNLHKIVKHSNTTPELVNLKLVSLEQQVREHLLLPLDKGPDVRQSDWSSELNMEQIRYAASDAYAGLRLYHSLDAKRKLMDPVPDPPQTLDERRQAATARKSIVSRKALAGSDSRATDSARVIENANTTEPDEHDIPDEEYITAPSSPIYSTPPESPIANLASLTLTSTNSTTMSNSTIAKSTTAELVAADAWVTDYLACLAADGLSPHVKGRRHLRAYALWHHQNLSITKIASLCQISKITAAGYVLDALLVEGEAEKGKNGVNAESVARGQRLEWDRDRCKDVCKILGFSEEKGEDGVRVLAFRRFVKIWRLL